MGPTIHDLLGSTAPFQLHKETTTPKQKQKQKRPSKTIDVEKERRRIYAARDRAYAEAQRTYDRAMRPVMRAERKLIREIIHREHALARWADRRRSQLKQKLSKKEAGIERALITAELAADRAWKKALNTLAKVKQKQGEVGSTPEA